MKREFRLLAFGLLLVATTLKPVDDKFDGPLDDPEPDLTSKESDENRLSEKARKDAEEKARRQKPYFGQSLGEDSTNDLASGSSGQSSVSIDLNKDPEQSLPAVGEQRGSSPKRVTWPDQAGESREQVATDIGKDFDQLTDEDVAAIAKDKGQQDRSDQDEKKRVEEFKESIREQLDLPGLSKSIDRKLKESLVDGLANILSDIPAEDFYNRGKNLDPATVNKLRLKVAIEIKQNSEFREALLNEATKKSLDKFLNNDFDDKIALLSDRDRMILKKKFNDETFWDRTFKDLGPKVANALKVMAKGLGLSLGVFVIVLVADSKVDKKIF